MLRRTVAGVAAVGVIALGDRSLLKFEPPQSPHSGYLVRCHPRRLLESAAGERRLGLLRGQPTCSSSRPRLRASAAVGSVQRAAGDAHGGVTLAATLPISTTQGTKPLTVENNPIPSLEDNFNAFNSNGFGYKLNIEGLFYEPLLMFNDLKANTAYPWLATDFAWNADGTAITFTLGTASSSATARR